MMVRQRTVSVPFPGYAPIVGAVAACFFVTGSAGLIYEIVWSRMLALAMGNTSYALATLLTVFMGGLALGAWIAGRHTPGGRRALRAYGLLELGIGAYCWLLPWLLEQVTPLLAAVYRRHDTSQAGFGLMQFAVAGFLLLVPTTMMGATLPILVRAVVRRLDVAGRTIGILYAINALGAFTGGMLAGLVLLPAIGMRATYLIAVALNGGVGLAAMLLSFSAFRGIGKLPEDPESAAAPAVGPAETALFPRGLLLAGFGVCGFSAMVYQVAWTRAVSMAIGSSTYAFTLISGAFLAGIGLGALMLGWVGDRPWGRYAAGAIPLGIGLSALATVAVLGELPLRVARWTVQVSSFAEFEWYKFRLVFLTFLVPTIGMGGLLPVVARLMTRRQCEAARAVGDAYAANAVGTIAGSFCCGFLLIPWVGMRASILIGAALNAVVGLAFLVPALPPSRVRRAMVLSVAAGLVGLALAAAPAWERSVMTSGPFTHAYAEDGRESNETLRSRMQKQILYYEEGIAALVAVAGDPRGNRELIVAGKRDASSVPGIQSWLGHVPMLMRPAAHDVLVVGLGGGHTLAAVAAHPGVERIDSVEISAEVIEAARTFFGEFTGDPLADPRVHSIVGDGRLHLEYTDRTYDVIVSQPSNPWIAGAAPLFTAESFEAMRGRLAPGGLACIWAQGYAMPVDAFRSLARTWAAAWEHASVWVWHTGQSYLFLGSDEPTAVDFEALSTRFRDPRIGGMLRGLRVPSPAHLLGDVVTDRAGLLAFAGGAPLNTDDGARIEFDTPRGLFRDHSREILAALAEHRIDPWYLVSEPAAPDDYYRANRRWLAGVVQDHRAIEAAANLGDGERRKLLGDVLRRNPMHWAARRELDRLDAAAADGR